MRLFYPAPPDRVVFWTTRLYWVVTAVTVITALNTAPQRLGAGGAVALAAAIAGLLVLTGVIAWGLQPRVYGVNAEAVIVQRRAFFPPVRLPLAEITTARPLELSWLRTLRLWGVGGLYSFSGWFWTPELGRFWMSATNGHHLALLDGERRVVLSPEDRPGFLAAVEQASPRAARIEEELEAEP